MGDSKQERDSSETLYCPITKHKIHCSQLEGTEASELPKERQQEFCVNKCPAYKMAKGNMNKQDKDKILYTSVYQDRILRITKSPTAEGYEYKVEMTDGAFSRCWEKCFDNDDQAIETAKREFRNLCRRKEESSDGW